MWRVHDAVNPRRRTRRLPLFLTNDYAYLHLSLMLCAVVIGGYVYIILNELSRLSYKNSIYEKKSLIMVLIDDLKLLSI